MADYPGSIPTIPANKTNDTLEHDDHPEHHNKIADELIAALTELGTNPSGGGAATVSERLTTIEGAIGGGPGAVDASDTVKGISKLSTPAAVPTNPVVVGDNDARMGRIPSTGQQQALAGTSGTPSSTNKYVTNNDPRMTGALVQTPPSIEDLGVVRNSQASASANTTAFQQALNDYRAVVVPPGGIYWVNSSLVVPTETTIYLYGTIAAVAGGVGFAALPSRRASLVLFDDPIAGSNEGRNGGIIGCGVLDANKVAPWALDVSSWDHGTFRDFNTLDPVTGHIHLQGGAERNAAGGSGFGTTLDCDAHLFDHVACRFSDPAGVAYGILGEDGGGNDSTFSNMNIVGLKETGFTGSTDRQDGGIGIQFKNCYRWKLYNSYVGDNNRRYTAALVIKQDVKNSAARNDFQSCLVSDFYSEAQAPGVGGQNWVNASIRVLVTATATNNAEDVTISRHRVQSTGMWKKYHLHCLNNSGTKQITGLSYQDPRGHLDTLGDITLSDGTVASLIEVRSAQSGLNGDAAFIVNGSATNNYVAHTRSGAHAVLT